ncbi:hypothetical protein M0811_06959 [Anaeramoeba ignava]|uniref:BTB domain-containing protein n=1 Tax=Anaeramoeba ignava TaxID=1746090 RepID=A0A9Q0LND1_ANAIG|nr:hypothetical protein M0811_06959 [Anaeramoeba ignava]
MNDIWFFGEFFRRKKQNQYKEIYLKPIQFKFKNENENENEKQIKQIATCYDATIFLFKNGKAIKYLRNSEKKPEKIPIRNIKKISVNSFVIGILTVEGNVFVRGEYMNLQNPDEFINISSLIEDTNDRIIEDVICGFSSIYLLTSNENVYVFGDIFFFQNFYDMDEPEEKPILMMKNVSKMFSGNSSSSVFFLNSNQELFAFGKNNNHQLGLGNAISTPEVKKPTKVQNIPKGKIIDIKPGFEHSIMLIANDDVNPKRTLYSCGNYKFNGIGENQTEFTKVDLIYDIVEISCGNSHTLVFTSNKQLFGFGENVNNQLSNSEIGRFFTPFRIELPKLRFNEDISHYHISCGHNNSFFYYSPFLSPFSNLEEDLIKLFERKEFCDISFKTKNGEIIEAHKLILKYRLNQNQNEIEKLKEFISNKSIKESNQIFEMIYSNRIINPKLYSEIKKIINSNEKIEETIKRIYLNENENENEKDFIIERKEKQYKFPKLILIMRSELYRGMFLSVTNDTSNKVRDYSELSNKSFQIIEYWIYSNQIKNEIQITQEIINELERGIDYFQLNQTNPNLFDLLINKFNNQNQY